MISGNVQLYMSSVPTLIGQIRKASCGRSPSPRPSASTTCRNVPTIAESGYKGFDAVTWFGFLAPGRHAQGRDRRLNAEFNKALQQPELRKKLGDEGADPAGGTPEQFAALIKDDIARWGKIVKESGARSTERRRLDQACRLFCAVIPSRRTDLEIHMSQAAALPDVIRDFERIAPDIVDQAGEFPSSILADVAGRRGALHGRIAPLAPSMSFAGPALTVEVRPGDNLMIHAAMAIAKPGDVLVVDGKGDLSSALMGEIMCQQCVALGVVGRGDRRRGARQRGDPRAGLSDVRGRHSTRTARPSSCRAG